MESSCSESEAGEDAQDIKEEKEEDEDNPYLYSGQLSPINGIRKVSDSLWKIMKICKHQYRFNSLFVYFCSRNL